MQEKREIVWFGNGKRELNENLKVRSKRVAVEGKNIDKYFCACS